MEKEKVKPIFSKLDRDPEASILRNEVNQALTDKDHERVESTVQDLVERANDLFEEGPAELQEYITQWIAVSRR